MRRGLRWLASLTLLGLVIELAVERHWTQPSQLIAWVAVAAAALALALVQWHASIGRIRLAQALALLVIVSAAIGIWQHVAANYDAGPLDYRYADLWDSLSEPTRWWLALTKTVGPAPLLAPGALAQAGACILLSTLRQSPTWTAWGSSTGASKPPASESVCGTGLPRGVARTGA